MAGRGAGAPLIVRLALRLYPSFWRERYGEDAVVTACDLVAEGQGIASVAWSYLKGAVRAQQRSTGFAGPNGPSRVRLPNPVLYVCSYIWLGCSGGMLLVVGASEPGTIAPRLVALVIGLGMLATTATLSDAGAHIVGLRVRRAPDGRRRVVLVAGGIAFAGVSLAAVVASAAVMADVSVRLAGHRDFPFPAFASGGEEAILAGLITLLAVLGGIVGYEVTRLGRTPVERARPWLGRFAGGSLALEAAMVVTSVAAWGFLLSAPPHSFSVGRIWLTTDNALRPDTGWLWALPMGAVALLLVLGALSFPRRRTEPAVSAISRRPALSALGSVAVSLALLGVLSWGVALASRVTYGYGYSAAETNLQTALTGALMNYTSADFSFAGLDRQTGGISSLAEIDTGLSYTFGGSSIGEHDVSVASGRTWVVLADWQPAGACFFIADLRISVDRRVAGQTGPGTFYGVVPYSPQVACRARRDLRGDESTEGFPSP